MKLLKKDWMGKMSLHRAAKARQHTSVALFTVSTHSVQPIMFTTSIVGPHSSKDSSKGLLLPAVVDDWMGCVGKKTGQQLSEDQ